MVGCECSLENKDGCSQHIYSCNPLERSGDAAGQDGLAMWLGDGWANKADSKTINGPAGIEAVSEWAAGQFHSNPTVAAGPAAAVSSHRHAVIVPPGCNLGGWVSAARPQSRRRVSRRLKRARERVRNTDRRRAGGVHGESSERLTADACFSSAEKACSAQCQCSIQASVATAKEILG